MADIESDLQIDGKSVYSLRVVDLKQELKKLNISFKNNATKAQLQSLIIQHLCQPIDTNEEDKSSEDLTPQSEDTNETIESNLEPNNVHSVEDKRLNAEQTEATDLSQDSGITSSVSFGEKQSIKLTIKLQPNDSPTKQMSPRSPKKSPTKELRSSVIVDEVKTDLGQMGDKHKVTEEVIRKEIPLAIVVEGTQLHSTETSKVEAIAVEDIPKIGEKVVQVVQQIPKHEMTEKVPKVTEITQSVTDNETSEVIHLSSTDSKQLKEKSKEMIKEKEEKMDVIEDNIVISEDISPELLEQKSESISSVEKEALDSSGHHKTEETTTIETIAEKVERKREKSTEKEKKTLESEAKEEKVRPPRRRRWGGSVNNESQQNTRKGISSDQLKELIPDMEMTDNSSTASKVSKSDSIVVTSSLSRNQTTEPNHEMPPKRDIRVVRKSISVTEEEQITREEANKTTQPIVEQKTKIVAETETESKEDPELKRDVSPPRSPESNIIFIRNLVRPFTLLQLKDVLGKTGKLNEQRFWIDKIKSKCFATYETVEEAVATRLALHGTRWPSSNPKLLLVEFATNEDLDLHLNPELNKESNDRKSDNQLTQKYDIIIKSDEKRNSLREKENRNEGIRDRPIREWDREKLVDKEDDNKTKRRPISPTRSRSKDRDNKRRRIGEERVRPADSTSEEVQTTELTKRPESPAKLLDDLFRKTTATPSIYWLPLTEEQAVARVGIREEEEKKRIEERNAREEEFRKRQERRPFDGPSPPFRNERNQWRTDSPPNRRNFGRRGSPPPRRSPPGRRSPPRRRSPPNRISRSRSRSPIPRRRR